jgi:hypothetical protein
LFSDGTGLEKFVCLDQKQMDSASKRADDSCILQASNYFKTELNGAFYPRIELV